MRRSRTWLSPSAPTRRSQLHARVAFAQLPPAVLERYLDSGEWRDKAGGYGIQGAAAAFATVEAGAFDTVVGLPVATLRELLRRAASAEDEPCRTD